MGIKREELAGSFYPKDAGELSESVHNYLDEGKDVDEEIKALIAPHAGYVYSGPVAGSAYKGLRKQKNQFKKIILMGPCHHYPLTGMIHHSAREFRTPLGPIPVAQQLRNCKKFEFLNCNDEYFYREHSLEVHLPFIQTIFHEIEIMPILVGKTSPEKVDRVIEEFYTPQTLIVISSDLSHFLTYDEAKIKDENTCRLFEQNRADELDSQSACGLNAIRGLLHWGNDREWILRTSDVRNSGDTHGSPDSVVGYGAFHLI